MKLGDADGVNDAVNPITLMVPGILQRIGW